MESFADYSSDSDAENGGQDEGQNFQPPPAWEQDDEDDDDQEENEVEVKPRVQDGKTKAASDATEEETETGQKKRRLLPNPLDALSSATTSFLTAKEEQEAIEEAQESKTAVHDSSNKKREESEEKALQPPSSASTTNQALPRKETFDKKESTRQKNTSTLRLKAEVWTGELHHKGQPRMPEHVEPKVNERGGCLECRIWFNHTGCCSHFAPAPL
eukprot:753225-Hanusia_phi.AAC.3